MSNFDDELALFESEISSLVQETEAGASSSTDQPIIISPGAVLSAPPVSAQEAKKQATTSTSAAQSQRILPHQAAATLPLQAPLPGLVSGLAVPPLAAAAAAGLAMLVPPQMRLGGAAPVPPVPMAFMPPQLARAAANAAAAAASLSAPPIPPPVGRNATIESAPTLYEPQPDVLQAPKFTMALPADIEKMEYKRQTDPLKLKMRDKRDKKKYVRAGGGQVWEDSSLAEWDDNDFRIFCGDLGNEVSDELLGKAFRKYASFQKAKVIRDGRTNKSKGYGFVSFRDSDDYIRAMREMDGKYVGNRPIKLRKSNWKDRNFDTIKKKEKVKKQLGLWS